MIYTSSSAQLPQTLIDRLRSRASRQVHEKSANKNKFLIRPRRPSNAFDFCPEMAAFIFACNCNVFAVSLASFEFVRLFGLALFEVCWTGMNFIVCNCYVKVFSFKIRN